VVSHIFVLGLIQALRALLGGAAGAFLIYRSFVIPAEWQVQLEPGDRGAFLAVGIVFLALAALRGMQGWLVLSMVAASRRRDGDPNRLSGRRTRRMGLALAILDLIDITLFPVTTACGTYGLLVYRHPDSLDFFEGAFGSGPPAVGSPPPATPAPAQK
jgi:hypothetical protein